MATRSLICQELDDGTVKYIYCHWDGGLWGVGRYLHENYQDRDKVAHLLSLGNLSSIGSEIHDCQPTSDGSPASFYDSRVEFMAMTRDFRDWPMGAEYIYLLGYGQPWQFISAFDIDYAPPSTPGGVGWKSTVAGKGAYLKGALLYPKSKHKEDA